MDAEIDPCLDLNRSIPLDTACLRVSNAGQGSVSLYSHFWDCILCDGQLLGNVSQGSNVTFQLSTKYPLHLSYEDENSQWCNTTFNFKEHGQYGWNITDQNCASVYTIHEQDAWTAFQPFFLSLILCTFVSALLIDYRQVMHRISVYRRQVQSSTHDDLSALQENDDASQLPSSLVVSKTAMRMHSLDTFRGIAVLLMIFVNNGGGQYTYFNHSPWTGLTVADLVLPWFAFAMGFSIVSSVRVQLRLSISRWKLILRHYNRTLALILAGLMINSCLDPNFDKYLLISSIYNLRYPGVLQLLAVSYFVSSSIETIFGKAQRNFQSGRFKFMEDILERWAQWLFFFVILAVHTSVTFLLPVPGCPRGYMGPGGDDHHGDYKNCTAGAAGYIDRIVFGSHIYNRTENIIYGTLNRYDPEGIMNTIAATLIVFMGVHAGRILTTYYQAGARIKRWLIWSAITGLIAGILCNFSKYGGVIPVTKNMMSLSYVLVTTSFAFLLYAVLYYIVEHKKWWNGVPFIYAGANPLTLYILHYLTRNLFPFSSNLSDTPAHLWMLPMNLWTTMVFMFIGRALYNRDIILTV